MTELSDTDRLYNISNATNDDGTIDVELTDFNRSEADDMVSVEFLTPNGEVESEVMPWPKEDSEEYKFVRIFNQTGYGIISAEEACENNVTVKAERDPWRIHAPHNYTRRERIGHKWGDIKHSFEKMHFQSADNWSFFEMLAVSPLFIPMTILMYPLGRSGIKDVAVGYGMALWHILIWVAIVAAIVIFI